jgi:[ribosomal protein S5]-alanine N-acetyltransferase
MLEKIIIRPQNLADASDFHRILNQPQLKDFGIQPTLDDEIVFLKANERKKELNTDYNFTILLNDKIIGAIGVMIQYRKHIGEIGYFLDFDYWSKGYATQAVALIEKFCVTELKLKLLLIIVRTTNFASQRVAEKSNYIKKCLLENFIKKDNEWPQVILYAKTI